MERRGHDTEATRRDLIASGRQLFSEVGYAQARTEEIVARAGLTRGALYHHFGNKEGLFRSVLEQIHIEVAGEVNRRGRAATGGPLEALRAGFRGYLDAVLGRDVRRILLVDGPAVIGWEAWHALDLEHGFGATRTVLDRAMQAGEVRQAPLDELTHVLLGAVTQAGLELGRSDDSPATRRRYQDVIDLLIDGLQAPGAPGARAAPPR